MDAGGDLRGTDILQYVFALNDSAIVERVLKNGVEPFELDRALVRVAETGNPDNVRLLLSYGADPDARNVLDDGKRRSTTSLDASGDHKYTTTKTPLVMACYQAHSTMEEKITIVRTLIEKGVNASSEENNKALCCALGRRQTQLAQILMDAGADGTTDRAICAAVEYPESVRLLLHRC